MSKQAQQSKITDPTNPKQIPKTMQPLTEPKIPVTPITPTKQTPTPKPQEKTKPIPQELLILTRGIEEIEGILYAIRQQILQLYGPVDYTNISDIELRFTEQQAAKLSFELKGEHWIIKPKQFLGEQMFADIASTVRVLGGEYISAGRDSHFRVKRA